MATPNDPIPPPAKSWRESLATLRDIPLDCLATCAENMSREFDGLAVLIKLRGYVAVAVGVLVVVRILHTFVGRMPKPPIVPESLSQLVLVTTVLLAMLVYRQTNAAIHRHEAETRDHLRAVRGSMVSGKGVPSEDARIAREIHRRYQRATAWTTAASLMFALYLFGIVSVVREANIPDERTGEDFTLVVIPPVLPADAQAMIQRHRENGSYEPLDDVLSDDGGYFAESFQNEHPSYVILTILPLYISSILMCTFLTRAFAYSIHARPKRLPPTAKANQDLELKSGTTGNTKLMPDGEDGLDAALDIGEDVLGIL